MGEVWAWNFPKYSHAPPEKSVIHNSKTESPFRQRTFTFHILQEPNLLATDKLNTGCTGKMVDAGILNVSL